MNVIALIDCNNFFVSCEALFNPSLTGKAVCVLSNNDGCIIARSNEAKKLGVAMGMPYFMAKKQFKNRGIVYISGNKGLYGEISSRIMKKLHTYTPTVEVYSIDEAFLELSGIKKMQNISYEKIAEKIKREVKAEIGIDISIGLSYSKTLAKLASNKAKVASNFECEKFPTGLYKIGYKEIKAELSKILIEDVWGIGRNSAALLGKYFIKTALDFTNQNDIWLKRTMGKVGLDLKQELLGNSISSVKEGFTPPKSIQKTASFPSFSSDKNFIKNELIFHSHRICKKLRSLDMMGEVIEIILRRKDFQVQVQKISLEGPTNSEFEVNKTMMEVFERLYSIGVLYRACGLTVSKLNSAQNFQLSLLNFQGQNRAKSLSGAWDRIENKFGNGKVHLGANAISNNK